MIYILNKLINIHLIILSVNLLFKVSAAPFHSRPPPVYDTILAIITIGHSLTLNGSLISI